MFVWIEHPGEAPTGCQRSGEPEAIQCMARRNRPAGARGRCCIVITKDDGGDIGSWTRPKKNLITRRAYC